ncbi:MAG TPA: hypothetical protein VGQ71_10655 [Terriglobales bacterium]|jgi:hypothetical protein|nr:hypothetical protein [Terriglobales bacterium]
MSANTLQTRCIAVTLALLLCGLPDVALAAPQGSQPQAPQSAPAQDSVQPAMPYPAHPTLAPQTQTVEPQAEELPDAPSSGLPAPSTIPAAEGTPAAQAAQAPLQPPPARTQEPVGTAAAERGVTRGGPASKPAGVAIAPAKQRQVRSLLIKFGAIAGAGLALGAVFALSKGTSSRPPGAPAP